MGGLAGFAPYLGKIGKKAKSLSAGGDDSDEAPKYHKGGRVRKTGLARLKKGELVLTKGQQKQMRKRMRGK